MKENEISTSDRIAAMLIDFSRRNNIAVRLDRLSGSSPPHPSERGTPASSSEWRITIDPIHAIVVESQQFPDHLVGELVDLADSLRSGLHALGE